MCETYSKEECLDHADTCVLCKVSAPGRFFGIEQNPPPLPRHPPVFHPRRASTPAPPPQAWGRVDVCFEAAIAQKLPSKLFTCDFPAPPPPSPSDPGLGTDCQSFKTEDACSQGGCVWCVSAAVPSSCYTEEEAKRLPAAVFQCKLPSLAEA